MRFGLVAGMAAFTSEYAIYGLRSDPGAVPGGAALAWVSAWMFPFYLALLAALLVLFPSGRLPRPAGGGCCGLPASATPWRLSG